MINRLLQASEHQVLDFKASRTITIRRKTTDFPTLMWGNASSPASSINCLSDAARNLDRPSTGVSILPLEDGKSLESQPSNKAFRTRLRRLILQDSWALLHSAPAWFRVAIPDMDSPRALRSNSTLNASINPRSASTAIRVEIILNAARHQQLGSGLHQELPHLGERALLPARGIVQHLQPSSVQRQRGRIHGRRLWRWVKCRQRLRKSTFWTNHSGLPWTHYSIGRKVNFLSQSLSKSATSSWSGGYFLTEINWPA